MSHTLLSKSKKPSPFILLLLIPLLFVQFRNFAFARIFCPLVCELSRLRRTQRAKIALLANRNGYRETRTTQKNDKQMQIEFDLIRCIERTAMTALKCWLVVHRSMIIGFRRKINWTGCRRIKCMIDSCDSVESVFSEANLHALNMQVMNVFLITFNRTENAKLFSFFFCRFEFHNFVFRSRQISQK